jgi:hypothetical protein
LEVRPASSESPQICERLNFTILSELKPHQQPIGSKLKSRQKEFPALEAARSKGIFDFLNAMKKDLGTDFECRTPVALLDYSGILCVLLNLIQSFQKAV